MVASGVMGMVSDVMGMLSCVMTVASGVMGILRCVMGVASGMLVLNYRMVVTISSLANIGDILMRFWAFVRFYLADIGGNLLDLLGSVLDGGVVWRSQASINGTFDFMNDVVHAMLKLVWLSVIQTADLADNCFVHDLI